MRKNLNKFICYATILAFALSLMFGAVSAVYADNSTALKAGDIAIVKTKLNFRAGAAITARVITVLAKGIKVTIIETAGSWYKVKLESTKTGYVHGKYIELYKKATLESNSTQAVNKVESTMVLATTTSTRDTGLLDVLIPSFEKKYGVKTKVVAVGSGEAMEMGKQGNADVLLVHSRKAEDEFIAGGFGVNRKDVMYNYFFLVGPKDDPAKIAGGKDIKSAFAKIADSKAVFVSRGDKSGTNTKELTIWDKAAIKPQGNSWYKESGQGMGDTLMMSNEMGAYTLVDSGTWYAFESKLNMQVIVEGDSLLFNPYGVIAVNPAKYPNIHYNAAMAFVNFITSEEGQSIIGSYIKDGNRLFVPNATK